MKYILSLLLLLQCLFLQAQNHNGDDLLLIPRFFANYTWNSGPETTRSTAGVFATEWMISKSMGSSGFGLELGFGYGFAIQKSE